MVSVNVAQVRAALAANRRTGDTRNVLALTADAEWVGPATFDITSGSVRVVACGSPLAVREAILTHGQQGSETLVVLTPCTRADLGLDVCARLIKGTVVPVDPYAAIHALFGAKVLDPQLVAERWLLDDLIALAPSHGWLEYQPLGGVLDAATAWRAWERARLGLTDPPTGLGGVLALGATSKISDAVATLTNDQRAALAREWAGRDDALTQLLVDLLADGRRDLLALGLVAEVCWAATDDAAVAAQQAVARARFEPVFGRDRLDERAASAWGDAATRILDDDPNAPSVLTAAERLLDNEDVLALALLSDALPRGFDERLGALAPSLARRDVEASTDALESVQAHRYAGRRPHRVEMAAAAIRLLRRSVEGTLPTSPGAASFASAAWEYAHDGAWVDEARGLLVEGESVPELAAAYQALVDTLAAEQSHLSIVFAGLLAEWSKSEPVADARVVPVEQILDEVVVPIAQSAPVLVVVCDGMGLPVAHTLLRDLLHDGWAQAMPATRERWPIGVATIPTVTETSRTSLLAGRRVLGGQKEEREGFASHPGLRMASKPDQPPVLFHKGALVAPNGLALPDEVRAVVADPGQRVVGVVVNSVDDHLARGDQVRVPWDLTSLRPLSWLLDAAQEAGRVVVLTADHGHVLQGPGSVVRQLPGGGERWRGAPPPVGDGEIEIVGPRVLHNSGRVIVPADDRLHYAGHKHGYHGGATPEEVLVPVAVLAHPLPAGWVYEPSSEPDWWRITRAVAPPTPAAEVPTRPKRHVEQVGQSSLFEVPTGVRAPASSGLVDALLVAPTFATAQKRARLPRPIADDRLRRYLEAIEQNGGSIPLAALSERTGEPADALRIALALVQRLLNVDGAGVLTVRADGTIDLNRELLRVQFELEAS